MAHLRYLAWSTQIKEVGSVVVEGDPSVPVVAWANEVWYPPGTGVQPNVVPFNPDDPNESIALRIAQACAAASAAGGGTVYLGQIPPTYDPPANPPAFQLRGDHTFIPPLPAPQDPVPDWGRRTILLQNLKNVTIDFGNAVIRRTSYLPTANVGFQMLRLENCENMLILNATFDGNRRGNPNPPNVTENSGSDIPDHCVGLFGCRDITFKNVRCIEALQDGFYLAYSANGSTWTPSERITLEQCSALRSARNGLTLNYALNVVVRDSEFSETGMALTSDPSKLPVFHGPAAGVDVECDPGAPVTRPGHRQTVLENLRLYRNGGAGIQITAHEEPEGVIVRACEFFANSERRYAIWPSSETPDKATRRAHLAIYAPGVTAEHCLFRPILQGSDEPVPDTTEIKARAPYVIVKVGTAPSEHDRTMTRLQFNRFVGREPGDTLGPWIERASITVDNETTTSTVIHGNSFQGVWRAAYLTGPDCEFSGNLVLDTVVYNVSQQSAVSLYDNAQRAKITDNQFLNVSGQVVYVGNQTYAAGVQDARGLNLSGNYVSANPALLGAAFFVGRSTAGEARVCGNTFARTLAPSGDALRAAVQFDFTGVSIADPIAVLRDNRVTGTGWVSGGLPSGAWQVIPTANVSLIDDLRGNHPDSLGEASFPGDGGMQMVPLTRTPGGAGDANLFSVLGTPSRPYFTDSTGTTYDLTATGGNVIGPLTGTNNAIPLYNGDGTHLKNSTVTIDSVGNLDVGNVGSVRFGASTRQISEVSGILRVEGSNGVQVQSGNYVWLDPTNQILLDAGTDTLVSAAGTTFAEFEGTGRRLAINGDGFPEQYATGLTVMKGGGGTGGHDYVTHIVNPASNATRVLRLSIGSAASSTGVFIRCLSSSNGQTNGILQTWLNSDGEWITTFTGRHFVIFEAVEAGDDSEIAPGLIVESVGRTWNKKRMETALPVVRLARKARSKTVYGVVSSDWNAVGEHHLWGDFDGAFHPKSQVSEEAREVEDPAKRYDDASRHFKCRVNSLGEGMVWVTDLNGAVENGDYIVTSDLPGHGMRADDDILRSSTVAKCVEDPDWTAAEVVVFAGKDVRRVLVACTYHCG